MAHAASGHKRWKAPARPGAESGIRRGYRRWRWARAGDRALLGEAEWQTNVAVLEKGYLGGGYHGAEYDDRAVQLRGARQYTILREVDAALGPVPGSDLNVMMSQCMAEPGIRTRR